MTRFTFFMSIMLISIFSFAQYPETTFTWTNAEGTQTRNLVYYSTISTPTNLLIALGGLGDGDDPQNYMGSIMSRIQYTDIMDNTIIVCPHEGTNNPYHSSWIDAEDEGIVQAIIDKMETSLNITNVYLQGFSYGGRSAVLLGLRNTDKIKGFMSFSPAFFGDEDVNNDCTTGSCSNYEYDNASEVLSCFATSLSGQESESTTGGVQNPTLGDTFSEVAKRANEIMNAKGASYLLAETSIFYDTQNIMHALPGSQIFQGCWDHITQGITPPAENCTDLFTEYTMGFEDNEDFSEWKIENVNDDFCAWTTSKYADAAHSGENFVFIKYNSNLVMNDYFYTKCLDLVAGNTYELSFWYKARSGSDGTIYPERLEVKFGTSAESTSMTNTIVDLGTINNIEYLESVQTFTPSVSGTYYVGFHGYSLADEYNIFIDDIKLKTISTITSLEGIATKNSISAHPNPANEFIIFKSTVNNFDYQIISMDGKTVLNGNSGNNSEITIDISKLESGLYNIVIISNSTQFNKKIVIN